MLDPLEKEMTVKSIQQPLHLRLLAALLLLAVGALMTSITGLELFHSVAAQSAAPEIAVLNAASYINDSTIAPDTITAAFGNFQTSDGQFHLATALPLPTVLGGIRVTVNGTDVPLLFTSNEQINFVLPGSIALGTATINVFNANSTMRAITFTVASAAPGVFSFTSNGQGPAVAQTTSDGVTYRNTTNPDGSLRDVDAGTPTQPNALVLYTTGVRHAPAANPNDANGVAEATVVTIQGVPAQVLYAGKQNDFVGLDQINVIIPPELAGMGEVQIKVITNGHTSNVTTMKLGGTPPPVRSQAINPGDLVSGALTVDDQVQDAGDGSGDSFFFDAYRFHAAANTSIAVDLRSSQFDAAVLLYQVNSATGALNFLAADDQLGGLGTMADENNNALLLTVLPSDSDYVILASTSNVDPNGVGNYTLRLLTNAFPQISYGQSFNANIASTALQTSANDYLNAYWFSGSQGDQAQITMTSSAFDSFLILNQNNGDLIAFDGPIGAPSARITQTLPQSGIYVIIATPFEPFKTGSYSLQLTRLTGLQAQGIAKESGSSSSPSRGAISETPRRDLRASRFALRRIVKREQ